MSEETVKVSESFLKEKARIDAIAANLFEEADSFPDFVSDITQKISEISSATRSAFSPQTLREHFEAFTGAINFGDPFFKGVLAFHILIIIVLILTRKSMEIQAVLFIFCATLILAAEPLNNLAGQHWQELGTQNYFDIHGVFMGIFFCAPLLLCLLAQLINFLYLASSALIQVKRLELKAKSKKAKESLNETEKTQPVEDKKSR